MPKAPENLPAMIAQIAADQFGADPASLTRETSLEDDLGADSLDRIDFVMRVERAAGVEIRDEFAERVRTLGDVEAEVRRLCA